jgi:hypothetical protein
LRSRHARSETTLSPTATEKPPNRRMCGSVLLLVVGPFRTSLTSVREAVEAVEAVEHVGARRVCERVQLWPPGDEPHQIELAATAVVPGVKA